MSDPSGPPDTRPPNKPPTTPPPPPPPASLIAPDLLSEADAVLADALFAQADLLLADLEHPAHRDRISAAVGAEAIARTGGPGPFFALPATPQPPRFDEGEHRLVGRVGGPDEADAEVLARILRALYACNP
jgi:hypothetical protein